MYKDQYFFQIKKEMIKCYQYYVHDEKNIINLFEKQYNKITHDEKSFNGTRYQNIKYVCNSMFDDLTHKYTIICSLFESTRSNTNSVKHIVSYKFNMAFISNNGNEKMSLIHKKYHNGSDYLMIEYYDQNDIKKRFVKHLHNNDISFNNDNILIKFTDINNHYHVFSDFVFENLIDLQFFELKS